MPDRIREGGGGLEEVRRICAVMLSFYLRHKFGFFWISIMLLLDWGH